MPKAAKYIGGKTESLDYITHSLASIRAGEGNRYGNGSYPVSQSGLDWFESSGGLEFLRCHGASLPSPALNTADEGERGGLEIEWNGSDAVLSFMVDLEGKTAHWHVTWLPEGTWKSGEINLSEAAGWQEARGVVAQHWILISP